MINGLNSDNYRRLINYIKRRSEYINNKLSCCMGYSKECKLARIEELDFLLANFDTIIGEDNSNEQ